MILLAILLVILLAIIGPPLALGWVAMACRDGKPRYATWYWRLWWFYGYHGLYQINWAWKRRRG